MGLSTQPSKATGQSPFFLIYGFEAILSADVMWQSPRLEMYEEGEADDARHLELDSAEEVRCNVLLQSPATYKASVFTMTGTFNNDLSILMIWSFATSRMRPGCTSLIHDGRDLSSCSRL
jgi:hypothetical protein